MILTIQGQIYQNHFEWCFVFKLRVFLVLSYIFSKKKAEYDEILFTNT